MTTTVNYYAVSNAGYNDQAGYDRITPEPFNQDGIRRAARFDAMDGTSVTNGFKMCDLIFDTLSDAEREIVLGQFGVDVDTPSNLVTVSLRNNEGTFIDYNAIAKYLQAEKRDPPLGWSGMIIRLVRITEAT